MTVPPSQRRVGHRLAAAIVVAGLVCAALVISNGVAFGESKPSASATATLEAVAVANAKAWFTGTVQDIKKYQGPECASKKQVDATPAEQAAELKKLRAPWAINMGRPLEKVKILGARVRNVTATSDEAEVAYDLPVTIAGDYNWVHFKRHDGMWKVSDCRLPFSGFSQNVKPAIPTT